MLLTWLRIKELKSEGRGRLGQNKGGGGTEWKVNNKLANKLANNIAIHIIIKSSLTQQLAECLG